MPSSPFFSGRIPQELLDAVEKHRSQTGESKTDVLIKSLAKYVGFQLPESEAVKPPIHSQLTEIFQRIESLEIELTEVKTRSFPKASGTQLDLLSDNKEITQDNDIQQDCDNNLVKSDNTRVLSTNEALETMGISQGTLSQWKTKRKLPQERNGYRIEFDHSTKSPRNSYWRVTKV